MNKAILIIGIITFIAVEVWLISYSKECYLNQYKECINASSWIEVYNVVGLMPILPFFIFIVAMIIRIEGDEKI